MRLSTFIKEALTDIAFGVHEAKVDSQELMAIVPGKLGADSMVEKSYVEFDIAVTAADSRSASRDKSTSAEGGIAVFAMKARIGGDRSVGDEASSSNEMVSRLQFKIPVFFNAHFRDDLGAAGERAFVKRLVSERTVSIDEPPIERS